MEKEKFHPLKIWNDQKVTDLLVAFFQANFQKAGLDPSLGEKIVRLAWEVKGKTDVSQAMAQIAHLFEQAKKQVTIDPDEAEPLSFFNLTGVKNFLDVGANKLATINYLAKKNPQVDKFIGIDTIPQNGNFFIPEKCEYFQVSADADDYPFDNNLIDWINIQFVFHHLSGLEEIKKILLICQRIISPSGSLVLWEESFDDEADMDSLVLENRKMNIQTDLELTRGFYNLDRESKIQFIAANDWIINAGNPHMPWTGQYYSWKEWSSIMSGAGFHLSKQYNFGLRVNGKLKQGVWMMGIFTTNKK